MQGYTGGKWRNKASRQNHILKNKAKQAKRSTEKHTTNGKKKGSSQMRYETFLFKPGISHLEQKKKTEKYHKKDKYLKLMTDLHPKIQIL